MRNSCECDFYFDNPQGKELSLDEMTSAIRRGFITGGQEGTLLRD